MVLTNVCWAYHHELVKSVASEYGVLPQSDRIVLLCFLVSLSLVISFLPEEEPFWFFGQVQDYWSVEAAQGMKIFLKMIVGRW